MVGNGLSVKATENHFHESINFDLKYLAFHLNLVTEYEISYQAWYCMITKCCLVACFWLEFLQNLHKIRSILTFSTWLSSSLLNKKNMKYQLIH